MRAKCVDVEKIVELLVDKGKKKKVLADSACEVNISNVQPRYLATVYINQITRSVLCLRSCPRGCISCFL